MKTYSVVTLLLVILTAVTSTSVCDTINPNQKTEVIDVVVNSSKLELNRTNITEYLGFSRIKLGFENITLAGLTPIAEQEDRYFIQDRRKACLENVTKCLSEDAAFKVKIEKINRLLFSTAPPFDLSKVHGVSDKCRQQSNYFRRELQRLSLWALKMYDATAKLPSGLLSGNVNQMGDFDMCLAVRSPAAQWQAQPEVKGKYCLSYLQVEAPMDSAYMEVLHDLVHGHSPFKSQLNDPGHRVPRYSTINWALCVPDTCGTRDVELGLQKFIEGNLEPLGLQVQVQVNEEMCQIKSDDPYAEIPYSSKLVGTFFIAVISFALLATIYDYIIRYLDEKSVNYQTATYIRHKLAVTYIDDILMAFSLRRNFGQLFSLRRSKGDIPCVHGIRGINAFMLIAAHKSMALFFIPYINRVEMSEMLGQPWSVLGRAASLYTDPFIMLSGMLTTYSFVGRLNKSGKINILEEYISRLIRLVPTLGALILFCTFVLPWLGSGPLWHLVVSHHADICKQTWWRNLLFIHNYFGFENMCLTHTHHIGIDTQLFALSPLLVWLIWKWPKKGFVALVGLATVSTAMRYYVTYTMHLSNYVHFGTSVRQLFDTADYMYILPAHRLTVYIIGVILGYVLRKYQKIHLDPVQIKIGDALAMLVFCLSFFGPAFMGQMDYKYNPTHAAWYAAFSPIAWCASFAWIIYKSHFGHEGFLGRFFSWRIFLVHTRLSYAVYLTQFPIFFYNVGVTRNPDHYTFFRLQVNLPELLNIYFYSIVLTLLFDTPFQNIKKRILRKDERKAESPPRQIIKDKEIKTD